MPGRLGSSTGDDTPQDNPVAARPAAEGGQEPFGETAKVGRMTFDPCGDGVQACTSVRQRRVIAGIVPVCSQIQRFPIAFFAKIATSAATTHTNANPSTVDLS